MEKLTNMTELTKLTEGGIESKLKKCRPMIHIINQSINFSKHFITNKRLSQVSSVHNSHSKGNFI